MALGLLDTEPVFAARLEECSRALAPTRTGPRRTCCEPSPAPRP
ncbi:hypothetical protein NKH77_00720 [Streptomyces sp. M19]